VDTAVQESLQEFSLALHGAGPHGHQSGGAALEELGLDALGPRGGDLVVQIRHEHPDQRAGVEGAGPRTTTQPARHLEHGLPGRLVHPGLPVEHPRDRGLADAGGTGDVDESRHCLPLTDHARRRPCPNRYLQVLAHSCTQPVRRHSVAASSAAIGSRQLRDSKEKTCRFVERASSPSAASPRAPPCWPRAAVRTRPPREAPPTVPPTAAAPAAARRPGSWSSGPTRRRTRRWSPPRRRGERRTAWRSSWRSSPMTSCRRTSSPPTRPATVRTSPWAPTTGSATSSRTGRSPRCSCPPTWRTRSPRSASTPSPTTARPTACPTRWR